MNLATATGRTLAVLAAIAAMAASAVPAAAGQLDHATFRLLSRGMSGGEVLVRAGAPDLVTTPGATESVRTTRTVRRGHRRTVAERVTVAETRVVERWHYVPGPGESDPWLTVVVLRGGEVWALQRTKVFSRARAPADAVPAAEPPPTTADVRSRQADRHLEAAQRYAEIRARLKAAQGLD